MEGASTDSLRALATKWSLAGDNQLLDLLQNTHQRITSKCQDVNSKLEEMASALDNASIHLQNVNNKFMALSNSQFVESRVYDDEDHLSPEPLPVTEAPQPSTVDELSMIKSSLAILERAHETAEILDDSDSDSDAEISVVLKPKDMYPERPLPYIIGTTPWKNKWHAGLIVEDSESDSSICEQRRDEELYSESASEAEETPGPRLEGHTISESGSSFTSDQVESSPVPQKPSDIAAELARRLGGNGPIVVQKSEEYIPTVPTVRKVYRPEKPTPGVIFPDEPPPLDTYKEEESQSEEDDIFAEINKNKPYAQRNTGLNNLADDLFSFDKPEVEKGDIFSDFAPRNVETKSAKQNSSLFEDEPEPEPELFAEPPQKNASQIQNSKENQEETSPKRPVGGNSLFGSNKGTESIGAAILKRNQPKSSTFGDESESDNIQNQNIEEKPKKVLENIEKPKSVAKSKAVDETDNKSAPKKEKDIFDDLFAKSKAVPGKKPVQKIVKEHVKDKEKTPVKNLFSDNMFDDIDDIFTGDVKMPTKESNQKSIFDDDDDLFAEIDKPVIKNEPKSTKETQKPNPKVKESILFDSDDDLFSEVNNKPMTKNTESHNIKDDKIDVNKGTNENYNQEPIPKIENVKSTETTKERNLFDDSPQNICKPDKPQVKSKGIFDSDSDEDIFAKVKTDKKLGRTENVLNSNNNTDPVDNENIKDPDSNINQSIAFLKTEGKKNIIQSPSLFEEDEIDDWFANANKLNTDAKVTKGSKIAQVENISRVSVTKDTKDTNIGNEDNTLSNVNSTENGNIFKTTDKQNLLQKSPINPVLETAEQSNIFGGSIPEDDLFSTAKEPTNMIHRQVDKEESVPSELEPSQDISESRTDSSSLSTEQTVSNKTNLDNTKTSVEKVQVVQSYESEQNANQSVFDDFRELAKEEVITSLNKNPVSNVPNVFDDIFTEPPAFEKPIEPKKSKNVNALFDDDSDDESLFFKKNDVISDEKPETFSKNANFDIFVDEPPAIDVDFTTKSTKHTDFNDDDDGDLFNSVPKTEHNALKPAQKIDISDNYEDLLNNVPDTNEIISNKVNPETKEEKTKATKLSYEVPETKSVTTPFTNTENTKEKEKVANMIGKINDSDEDLFNNFPRPEIPHSSQKDKTLEQREILKSKTETKKSEENVEDIFKPTDLEIKEIESKKIGKLNTKNFNINVNALIPGASPKKVPKENKNEYVTSESYSEPKTVKLFPIDGETDNYEPKSASDKVENEYNDTISGENEPKSTKYISFDEKSESGVLDNNLSKQRPKIQVKRRPSSRRARHEAVRKSAIDFGDDTDNSSSFDEPVKSKNTSRDRENIKAMPKETDIANPIQNIKQDKSADSNQKVSIDETMAKTNMFDNLGSNITSSLVKDNENQNEPSVSSQICRNIDEQKRGSTTKIVYILNDEDIFNTVSEVVLKESENKNIDIKNEEDIFNVKEGIKTLGKTYTEKTNKATEVNQKDVKSSEISTDVVKNDENTVIRDVKTPETAKTSLFDDSEEELFNENKKLVKKPALFDSDSEEDLFSGKKRTEKQNKEQKNRKVKERIEVKVKGSLFGDENDDDDNELFGLKKEKNEPKKQSSTSKEASIASKSAEPVFDDPLSMLGDD